MDASRGAGSFFFLLVNILTVAAVLLSAWNSTNADFKHTYLLPPNAPGTLTTDWYTIFWWLWQAALGVGIVLFGLAALAIAVPSNTLYRISHLIWAIVTFLLMIVFLIFHVFEIGDCNKATGGSPFCNDERWCCVYGAVSPDPVVPSCPYLLADCVPLVVAADLKWRGTFLFSFILVITLGVLALLHIIFNFVVGRGTTRTAVRTTEEAPLVTDETDLNGDIDSRYLSSPLVQNLAATTAVVKELNRERERKELAKCNPIAYKNK